jgi:hypothetical protein
MPYQLPPFQCWDYCHSHLLLYSSHFHLTHLVVYNIDTLLFVIRNNVWHPMVILPCIFSILCFHTSFSCIEFSCSSCSSFPQSWGQLEAQKS